MINTYDELKKWAWQMASRIQTQKITCKGAMSEMQELVNQHNSSHFADALIEAVIAYHEYIEKNITDESAQIRLRHGNDCYGKYINGVDIND